MKNTFAPIRWLNNLEDAESGPGCTGGIVVTAACLFFLSLLYLAATNIYPLNLIEFLWCTAAPWKLLQFPLKQTAISYLPHVLILMLVVPYFFQAPKRNLITAGKLLLWLCWPVPICLLQVILWIAETPKLVHESFKKFSNALNMLDYEDD